MFAHASAQPNHQPQQTYLKDYQPPAFMVDKVDLHFDLAEDGTTVTSTLALSRNPAGPGGPLVLYGVDLELVSLDLDGNPLGAGDYTIAGETLTISEVPDSFTLRCVTRIHPETNTALEGLYKSGGMFCTQCEAEGFRRITYYPDRPDVMSTFTTTIVADKTAYPVLLSNGNCVDSGDMDGGRHFAVWQDPFKKPCYLFALVAGQLEHVEGSFTTMSGRTVTLRIYTEPHNITKTAWAMDSLKAAMKWDEEVYGREYDLDIFNIVAVDDFNMGAMENKSLNIFNSSAVLASPQTATDARYEFIKAVVAHEYFHNWSGNRVTCRDWFQLSLKEGFTVFRDHSFSEDMWSPTVQRVEQVATLRTHQFAEDAGPMAHPVRPESYMEISNFYTLTVYEKGAEVLRMMHTLLGPERFRRGSDLYFERHDGQAVTTEDFVAAMEDANGFDLTQFKRWYHQAGTPEVAVEGAYDASGQTYTLTFRQSCPPTPESDTKQPFHIPVKLGLLGADGADMPLATDDPAFDAVSQVINLTETEQSVTFTNVTETPVPSLLRGFSAPVKLTFPYERDELTFLMAHDSDGFNRWEAGNRLAVDILQELIAAHQQGQDMALDGRLVDAARSLLADTTLDRAMVAHMLILPGEDYLANLAEVVDVDAIHAARKFARQALAEALQDDFLRLYRATASDAPYTCTAEEVARRSLHNVCLGYLMSLEEPEMVALAVNQFNTADNMTEQAAALNTLVCCEVAEDEAGAALASFYEKWHNDAQMVDQWFALQARCDRPGGVARVKDLMQHPAFTMKNPNKVRAVVGAFAGGNPVNFHSADGAGYQLVADVVLELNRLNPQIAARQLLCLSRWRRYDAARQALMKAQLERIAKADNLSPDVYEVVNKSLKG